MHSIQDVNNTSSDTAADLAANAVLRVHKLRIDHDDAQPLVQALSFELHEGETLAIVGESGSGKSISSLALLGLLPKTLQVSGQALISGQNLLEMTQAQLRRIRGEKIAMIFQEPMTALNPLHRVEKIIGESLLLRGWSKAKTRERVIQLLNDVGIPEPEEKLQRYPHELSGGQRQRVMIAMALALDPDILIADEPTTALDVTLQAQILNLLKSLQQSRKMALILISHDLNLVRKYADQVIVMHQGQAVEQGNAAQIFNAPAQAYTQDLLNHDFGEALTLNTQPAVLELVNVGVKFPIKQGLLNRVKDYVVAVEPLSMALQQGQSIGIVGESGSGKSSLALAVSRLIDCDGQILLLGQDLNQLNEKQLRPLRSNFQIVFQDPFSSLNPRLNVEQTLSEGLALKNISKNEIQQRIDEALQKVELPVSFKQRYPHELSGGQRQRIALARALVLQPKVLILDEPTSALDRTTQRAIVRLLRRLQQEYGMSYLFISHDLKVVKALCQKVLVLRRAKMVEFQDTETLFTQPQTEYTQKLIEASQY
ncbi:MULTISPECIES: dipeptide ABC transporter ATP-binding protein [Acinetobacter]|jgi:microcin C transport system ATP-binding protein|uniref:Dipeptide ABC transporter ATP-binding protein n=1 Tax=Acinetobacter entericus TaxID=2989714 RepID=A0ABT3NE84_9GAMM|nr:MULTISPECIES: dipeptide ABC transporter ATP-binding protein [Acinetobacter]MCW8037855.1 dipeptide ABC transporter ATP-binding protein [Acinetobacter entericus]TCB74605.1 ABC transporter ATP-binding protein [Acinetobacter sp. ANC 4177]